MYAEVIVDQRSRAVDRPFDYAIPKELSEKVSAGSRVIVPFSRGNRETEGFVLRTKERADALGQVKAMIGLSGDEPAFPESMVPLIEYLHKRCLAPYLDIIHAAIPAGSAVKTVMHITLLDKAKLTGRSETDKKIVSLLEDFGGGIDIVSLMSYFDTDIKGRLTELDRRGVISRSYSHERSVHKRVIRAVRLAVSEEEADEYIGNNKRAKAQKRMIGVLKSCEYLSAADLVRFSIGSYQTLKAVVKAGIAEYFDITVDREVYSDDGARTQFPELTPEQKAAADTICSAAKTGGGTFLLHGVTGSGKTEVFMRVIADAVERGKTAMLLVPEISLTPQMVSRFVSRFGARIAILHSGLSLGERYDQWGRIMRGEADIVIGARSAVFAPIENIGAVILDEEHSETYKSEMSPRYHAREAALFRAAQWGAAAVLASATPSAESYHKALCGEYKLLEMKKRYNENRMPEIEIVDMRNELEGGNKNMFSRRLYEAVRENIDRGCQTILLMNRRGYSTFVSCRKCGYVPMCPNCNISLTYHSYGNILKCHYCGYTHSNYEKCPSCGSKYIRYFGGGTQRVEDEVKRIFPDATSIRLDADVTTRKNSHRRILEKFAEENIDILIGTQMVAKGLDFPNVTLVGVISADTMLHINDFRSGERTFALLEQVSGRAGRGEKQGRAIIQTYNPDNFAIELVKTHDYRTFYRKTAEERRLMWYPPFCEMVCIMITDPDRNTVMRAAHLYRRAFGDINEIPQKLAVLGPIPSGISKIKNKYRWQILVKCENADAINERLISAAETVKREKEFADTVVSIDKGPVTIY